MHKKAKIVCTLGPSANDETTIRALAERGMDCVRLNCSHMKTEEIAPLVDMVRRVEEQTEKHIAVILDLSGPKIRIGELKEGSVELEEGSSVELTPETVEGCESLVGINYSGLYRDVEPGDMILLDDGALRLKVSEIRGTSVFCNVLKGGSLKSRKGLNTPGIRTSHSSFTEKDVRDLKAGAAAGIDWIALSFVRAPDDVLELRGILKSIGASIPIIAKIEKREALHRIREIIDVSSGIMVARGDLGVEIPIEEVPVAQKEIIRQTSEMGKPVITATQMLESMITSPSPTRAEATDVANAILDGTDAVMLSGETAVGMYPLDAVDIMSKIIRRTEEDIPHESWLQERSKWVASEITDSIALAACGLARDVKAKMLIAPTDSGFTACAISKYRPQVPVLALTPRTDVARRLCLVWGLIPYRVKTAESMNEMFEIALDVVKRKFNTKHADRFVVTAGVGKKKGRAVTNIIRLIEI